MLTFQEILERVVSYQPNVDRDLLSKAFAYANKAYAGQYTLAGDTYMDHCLVVTAILLPLKPDQNTVIASLLHVIADTPGYDVHDLEVHFGKDVVQLVSSLSLMNRLKSAEQKSEIESLRKMFLVMAQDLRVVLIKLADRLQNMQSLDCHSISVRKMVAKETLDIYVPIAARLGIYNLKVKLEDLCFQYLYPRQFDDLKAQMNEYMLKRGKNIEQIQRELESFLRTQNLEIQVDGRIKGLYSIYKKLKAKSHSSLDDIYDIFAMRVILPNHYDEKGKEIYDNLYSVLGLIHSKWKPLANRFKDYAAVPKPNGYQSLHTAVLGISPKSFYQPTEIQIRSKRMHEEAENGVASHWIYKENKKNINLLAKDKLEQVLGSSIKNNHYLDWIQALSKIQNNLKEHQLVEALKLDVFSDSIFVFTPDGAVKDLPKGSTPIDFAYAVHTDLGNHCQLAKVNGAVVSLHYELKNGEFVEIVVNNKSFPKAHWLSLVKTSLARNKIRSYLKSLDKHTSLNDGKEIINKALVRLGKPLLDEDFSLFKEYEGKKLSFKERVALVEGVGSGTLLLNNILKKLAGFELKPVVAPTSTFFTATQLKGKIILPRKKVNTLKQQEDVFIAGEEGVPYRFAKCCKPTLTQPIVAYITRGSAVTIHVRDCKVLKDSNQSRVLEASWGRAVDKKKYPVKLSLRAKNRVGLVRDIAEAIAKVHVNILDFGMVKYIDKDISREMTLELTDNEQYQQILESLQRIRNVYEVGKVLD